jgi:hypothetical protein
MITIIKELVYEKYGWSDSSHRFQFEFEAEKKLFKRVNELSFDKPILKAEYSILYDYNPSTKDISKWLMFTIITA